MKICKINERDYKEFTNKEMKLFFEDFFGKSSGREYYKIFNHKEKKFFFAAVDNGKILGTIVLRIHKLVASIGAFVVRKSERGKGIGSLLVRKCEQVAKKYQCKKIWLWTDPKLKAYKFYKSQGYKEEARLKKHFGGKDLSVMSKFF